MSQDAGDAGAADAELHPLNDPLADFLPQQTIYDAENGVFADVYVLNGPPRAMNNNADDPMAMEVENNNDATTPGINAVAGNNGGVFGDLLSAILGSGGSGGGRGGGANNHHGGGGGGGGGRGGPSGPGGDGGDDPLGSVTLDDVGGLDDQVSWLRQSVLNHLTEDSKLADFGVVPPKGILFYGPPGTGKTLLARAFGNELNKLTGKKVSFFHRRGPDVYSPWFGESSRQLKEIFAKAVKMKPSIIFFDELDGLCPSREGAIGDAASTVVTTLLGCMDTLPPGEVFVFGASNLVDSIDPAMRRPGRFDKHLEFFPPSLEARKKILEIHTKKWKNSHPSQVKIAEVAERTLGFTGADLEKLTRETVFNALERTVPSIHVLDEIEESGIEEMQITDDDWENALRRVKPSPAVFDSALYVPKIPDARVNPLVRRSQVEVLGQVLPLLPTDKEQAKEEKQDDPTVHVVKTLIIVDQEVTPMDTIGTYILPGVFADQVVSLLPVYLLSAQRLHACLCGPLTFLERTLKTVVNCGKPCILYIPMIDILLRELPQIFLPLAHGLQLLNAKKVLVIATSATESTELHEQLNFRNLFSGIQSTVYCMNPTQEETIEFLRPVFTQARDKMKENAQGMKNVDTLWRKASVQLNGATIKEHLNFHDELDKIIKQEKDTGVMMQKMEKAVNGFLLR